VEVGTQMTEPRGRQIVCNIEPTLYDVASLAASKGARTVSTYLRNLVISDLLVKGMISERTLTRVLTG